MTDARPTPGTAIVAAVVHQHADEAAGLWESRNRLVTAPGVGLFELRRSDERLAAHLDGLAVAGDRAWPICEAALEDAAVGAVFVAAVRAIEEKRQERLDRLFELAEIRPESREGLIAAFAWLERQHLQGTVAALLKSAHECRRAAGLAACGAHHVDPGLASGGWLQDPSPLVRGRALSLAGEIGCVRALGACLAALDDADDECRFRAARSAVLLGDRDRGLRALARAGMDDGPFRAAALALSLQAMSLEAAHGILQRLAADPARMRSLIQGSGIAGDPAYVSWLIGQMTGNETARAAGEAFALLTGSDLEATQLDRPRPENAEPGPTDDPEDETIDMDPDEGLPWPASERIQGWWKANENRFEVGTRHFMGHEVTRAHCLEVLSSGRQRQRILAAQYLCLLAPGTPLFNTSAPAWRQRTLLAQME